MQKPVLLTVDDDADVLRAIERDLRDHYGETYRVLRAESGQAALNLLARLEQRNEPVALFLVDHRMPQMNGIEFLTRAMKVAPDARRVLLTAYADTEAAIRAINEVRLDHYLLKPWDPPEDKLYPVLDDLLTAWMSAYKPPYEGLRILGTRYSPKAYELRDFLARNQVPYKWLDAENPGADRHITKLLAEMKGGGRSLPLAIFEDGESIGEPTTNQIAERIHLSRKAKLEFYDLLIVGAGPAGLAAAVYGASEGLKTVVVESNAPGGQAGSSSRIENYLGFPGGLSGGELTRRAVQQAQKFEAELLISQAAVKLQVEQPYKIVTLENGSELSCYALLIASGVQWRKLNVPGLERLQSAGVYYGGGISEAATCRNEDVFIVGGANSAGQAAMNFARYARQVIMLVRGKTLAATMSQYLIDQIQKTENIRVEYCTQVVEAHGEERLEGLSLHCEASGQTERVAATSLFIFIGAEPRTEWLGDFVARDDRGFILTGPEIPKEKLSKALMEREPMLLETNVPGVFAAGDARHGSVKRVASGVGEGSIAVQFVHQYLSRS